MRWRQSVRYRLYLLRPRRQTNVLPWAKIEMLSRRWGIDIHPGNVELVEAEEQTVDAGIDQSGSAHGRSVPLLNDYAANPDCRIQG